MIRQLNHLELVELHENELQTEDCQSGSQRAYVRTVLDDLQGWVTLEDKGGTEYVTKSTRHGGTPGTRRPT